MIGAATCLANMLKAINWPSVTVFSMTSLGSKYRMAKLTNFLGELRTLLTKCGDLGDFETSLDEPAKLIVPSTCHPRADCRRFDDTDAADSLGQEGLIARTTGELLIQALARMGLRPQLRHLRPTGRRTHPLAA